MNTRLLTANDLARVLTEVAKPQYRPRTVLVTITDPETGSFLRAVRCALSERTKPDVADALVTMIGDYTTKCIECGADGKALNAVELFDASLKRDVAPAEDEPSNCSAPIALTHGA